MADIRRLVRKAERAGWRVDITGRSHWRWYDPEGNFQFSSSSSPSDRTAINCIRRDLRRRGVEA